MNSIRHYLQKILVFSLVVFYCSKNNEVNAATQALDKSSNSTIISYAIGENWNTLHSLISERVLLHSDCLVYFTQRLWNPYLSAFLIGCGADLEKEDFENRTAYECALQKLYEPVSMGSTNFVWRFWLFCILASAENGHKIRSRNEFEENLKLIISRWREYYDYKMHKDRSFKALVVRVSGCPQIWGTDLRNGFSFDLLFAIVQTLDANDGKIIEKPEAFFISLKAYDYVLMKILSAYKASKFGHLLDIK